MSYTADTINYKGFTINIVSDDDPQDPRKWEDCPSKMYCFHNRYNLGDKHNYSSMEKILYELAGLHYEEGDEEYERTTEDLLQLIEERGHIVRKLFLYDHSGLSISSSSFVGRTPHASWDSGVVGLQVMEADTISYEWGTGPDAKEKAEKYMEGEVKTYDNYLTGQVYGYVVEETWDSCFGYYGWYRESGVIEDAKSAVDAHIRYSIKQHIERVKTWIRNKVPHIYRTPLKLM